MTLKEAYKNLMSEILSCKEGNVFEDYIELMGKQAVFSFEDVYKLKEDKRIYSDYLEMEKVFFSSCENIFGHSYGDTILTPYDNIKDPIDAICKILSKNINTRKAVLTFAPYGDEKVPCITGIQFMARDNMLNIFYTVRSQDVYRKFPCDAMCIASLGEKIAKRLNLKFGNIYANLISAHIYLKDEESAKQYIEKNL